MSGGAADDCRNDPNQTHAAPYLCGLADAPGSGLTLVPNCNAPEFQIGTTRPVSVRVNSSLVPISFVFNVSGGASPSGLSRAVLHVVEGSRTKKKTSKKIQAAMRVVDKLNRRVVDDP
jgi:hypothetical protein